MTTRRFFMGLPAAVVTALLGGVAYANRTKSLIVIPGSR